MTSSTTRAFVAKKQSTTFDQVATNLLNVLQGYSKTIRLLLVMFLTLTVTTNALGAEGEEHTFTDVKFEKLLNNNATISDVTISDPGYPVKTIIVNCRYNKTAGGVTISIKIGGKMFASSKTHNSNGTVDIEFTDEAMQGDIVFSFVNNCDTGTGKGTFYFNSVTLVEGAPAAPCTVTLKDDDSELTQSTAGGSVTLPPREGCEGYTFAGWTKSWNAPQTSWTTTAPTIIPAGSYTPTADESLYPVYTKTVGGGSTEYVLTDISTIVPGDVFILADANNYALTNNNETSSVVGVKSITVFNDKVTSTVDATIKWQLTGNNTDGYTFYPGSGTATWLYCNTTANSGSNNNMRVGTGNRKLFVVNKNGYLVTNDTYTARYLSRYDENSIPKDFRGYVNTNTNPVKPKLYKETSGSTTSYISVPECSTQTSTSTYTVKHCKEGLEAGSYPDDLIETETHEGTIGDQVTPGRKDYTGFTAPSGQKVTIQKDGALVVTYQYTRNSYTLTWVLDGGKVVTEGTAADVDATGTISKNVRYETPIIEPIVQREGYRFNKWDSSVSNKMPANNKSFTATWVKTWDIIWKAQGNTIQEVTVDADSKLTLPTEEVATCEGMTHIGWTEIEHYTSDTDAPDDFFTYAIGTVSENKIYHAVYALSCGYTKLDWGSEVPEGKYLISTGTNTIYGQNGTTKTYLGATAYAPTRELKPEYEVCIRKVGTAFAIQLLNTMWVGWASSSSTNTNLTIDSPETDAAYTWKYTKNGIQNQSAESLYLQINGTGSEGRVYTTTGSGSTWHPTYLYARNNGGYYTTCQTSVAIDYDLNGGTGNMSNTRVKSGSDYIIPTAVPTQVGKTFTHWSDGTNTYAAGATINDLTNDITLTAQWKVAQHTVTLNPNYPDGKTGTFKDKGGNTVSGNLVLTYDYNTASMTIASLYTSLTLDGYEFGGWHNAKGSNPGEVSGSKCTTTGDITGNKTYFAKWSKLHTVTFNTATNNPTVDAMEGTSETGITLPAGPTPACSADGWTFAGWWTESVAETTTSPGELLTAGSNYKPTEDCTLYAVYSKEETEEGGGTTPIEATLSFANKDQRTSFSSTQQVWEQNGITLTNNKHDSSSDVADYANPARFYAGSQIIINAPKVITEIVATCNEDKHATALVNSVGNDASSNNNVVTIIPAASNTTYTIAKLTAQVQMSSLTVTYLAESGPTTTTTYNSNPTCFEPVWEGATIDKTSFTVNCGERSPMDGANGAAKITFLKEKIYNFTSAITIEATTGFLVSTSQSVDANYKSSVSLSPLVGTTNANTFHEKPIYVRAEAPAQSDTNLEGTITIKNSKGDILQTFSVTADVTCTQYTLTLIDRGVSTEQPTKYYAGETINEAPADPEGVCTDPIHYVFDGWAAASVAEGSTAYTKVTFPYTVTGNTKFYAVYRYVEEGSADSGDYVKVTEDLDDYSGDYLIVYEEGGLALNGALEGDNLDASGNSISVTITNNTIVATDEVNASNFTIAKENDDEYSIRSASGYYIGQSTNANDLKTNSTEYYANTITLSNDDNADVVSSGAYLRYNAATGNTNLRFRYYKSDSYTSQKAIALYRKAASYLYTTSPVCGAYVEITSDKDIYVTGGNAGGTRDLVVAQTKVAYQATRLEKDNSTGNLPSIKVLPSNITYDADKTKAVTITFDEDSVRTLQPDGTYTISGTMTISYRPETNNVTDDIQVVLNANYNPSADVSNASFTVHARSLPEEFVIVAKQGDKWYALNGDMSNGSSAHPANGQITLDDNENPTKATSAPCNTIYTFDGLPNTGDRKYVRFQGTDGAWLWAASGTNVGIQNKSLKNTPSGNMEESKPYNWEIETENNITYFFHNANSSRVLRLNNGKFGMYVGGTDVIRILPYEAKCLYNYAPSNLKVSVLKSTYVTLTWDPIVGATKYQYSTDATNWTDGTAEPTITINGLTGATNYIYYIRAYHADAGVNQECFDYSEITFTTADCDDVPTDITYTADLNSITVSWNASAPKATIKLSMNADGTGGGGIYNGATSPYKISGGLTKNTTYYIQILADGTCASPIIPVKTEDVKVDVVEWQPQGIVVDINTNERVGVTLENEVSYGSGTGSEATELFFSKYYEATGNVKLVAIYNGTKNIIDLTDYEIHYGKDSWESQHITLKDFGETKGQIQPGEELILYTTNESNDDNKILDCVNKQYPDGKWVRVTQANNAGGGYLSFAGNKTLVLKKASTIIDVIGALNSDRSKPTSTNANEWPSWGDAGGWNCATGLSIADDTQIGISTNRCLLIRNNSVTSGANAVTSNIDDFVTLCSEWKGAQVPDNNVDNGVAASCENFAYVGTFDYSDYYTKFESMGDEIVFEENKRNPDGTVTIPITDLYKQSCRNIRIKLSNSNGDVLTDREYKVPIMITTPQGTDGQAFLALQENLATVEIDGNGNPTGNKTNLTLEQVREICKTCDVVVRDNATLMKMADDAENDHPQVRDIYVYENSSLVVPNGTNYTINNLSLRRKEDAVASVSAYPNALKLPESAAAPITLDFRLSAESWHWFTLPYDCNISEVTWVDGSPAQYNVDWFLMTYDGEKRAATQAGGCWKAHTGTTIKAGEGFILAINGNINNPAHTYELRFPMSKDVLVAEGTDKTVDVRAWGVETNIRPNHKGWNLVGNPYLAYYQRDNITKFEGLRLGQLTGPDPQTGYWEQTGDVPYVVVPVGAGWIAYEQVLASATDLLPFTAYFVQVGNDGKHESDDELSIAFDHTKLQLSATPMPASIIQRSATEDEEPIIVGVSLTNAKGESDKTSLIIDDQYTDEYEMHADFFKWFGDYYTYYTKPVLYTVGADQGKRAFNALNEELATQPVALGMYAAQAGEYTFTLDLRSDLSHVEEIWLHDATENIYTNLLQDSYTFSTGKINGEGRFFLSVKMKPQQEPDPDPEPTPDPTPDSDPETSLDDIVANRVFATVKDNVIYISGLLSDAQLWIYDAAGRLMHYDQTKYYQHTYLVPQGGAYFVRVQGTMQTQTIKVVVK